MKVRNNKIISLDDAENIADTLNRCQIESVYIFNLGEPFLPSDIYQQVDAIRRKNPNIRIITSTNGLLLDDDEKLEAALLMDYIYFSIDGIDQDMIIKYQDGGNFARSYNNMARLIQLRNKRNLVRPIVEWKYVLFRWNDHPSHAKKAQELAQSANVDLLGFYPGAAPLHERSLRYARHSYFRQLGEKVGEGTVVNFKGVPRHLLAP